MNSAIAWFAKNGVAANLLMVLILAGGLITVPGIRQEVFPELDSDTVQVTVEYFGASPSEIEESICQRVEEAIQGLTGVKRIKSTAVEGRGTISIELLTDADDRQVLDDVKTRVDAIDTFPDEAERPMVQALLMRKQVVNVAISGKADEHSLRQAAEQVRDDLSLLPEISLVSLANAKPYEISIEVSEARLRRHGLTLDEVARAVASSSLDLPGGSVKTEGGEILVRTRGQAYRGEEFEEIAVVSRADGTRLVLGDLAEVIDDFADTDQLSRFDGEPSALVQVFRVGEQGALDIARAVEDYIATAPERLPEGITLTTWQDDSKVLRGRLDLMLRNGRMGLILVFVCLALFLRLKLAIWVALGIPISFLGAVWLLPGMDISINLISLFAFIIVLGIVVDDAIVVGENIYTHVQKGSGGVKAAIQGAQEVGTPVTFAVLTTVAAFSPLLAVPGRYGQVMKYVPSIVIATLAFSLIESLFILPRHLSHFDPNEPAPRGLAKAWASFQGLFTRLLDRFVLRVYRPLLDVCLRWRYLTVTAGVGIIVITVGLFASGGIKFVFFPPVDADNVIVYLTMPQGTDITVTERAIRAVEGAADDLGKELEEEFGKDLFRHRLTSVGGQPFREAQAMNQGQIVSISGSHLAEVNIELVGSEDREISSSDIAARWRNLVPPIPDAEEIAFSASIFAAGDKLSVQLASEDSDALEAASETLKSWLRDFPGVTEANDSFRAGKQEIVLELKPAGSNFGLTQADLARQVRQAFYGEEVQRIQRGRDDVRVMVRYPADERRSIANLEDMFIRTTPRDGQTGIEVPFRSVATMKIGRGYSAINRADRQRVVDVSATLDMAVANAEEIKASLRNTWLPRLADEHPAVKYSFQGDQADQAEAMENLFSGFFVAILLIYALLAIPFRSYVQPLIVMSAIPFGVIAAIWGHVLLGMDFTFLSMFGIVALTGVLVNDSLVMVDFINRRRASGLALSEAVRQSGLDRFRPILLTSLTTFAGLSPLLLERSLQARFLIPMAVSLGFGVLFATFITLILVPVGYFILEDLGKVGRWVLHGSTEPRESPGGRHAPASVS